MLTILNAAFDDAAGLAGILSDAQAAIPRDPNHGAVVYVRDTQGRDLRAARLERERLTDGSFVYNLILVPSED